MVWQSDQEGEGPEVGRVKESCLEEAACKSRLRGP